MGIFSTSYNISSAIVGNLAESFRIASTKKQIKKLVQQVDDANYQARSVYLIPEITPSSLLLTTGSDIDVYRYNSNSKSPGLDCIWGDSDDPECMIVSGGSNSARVRALMPFVRKAQIRNIPVIVLHCGNRELEQLVSSSENSRGTETVGKGRKYYDMFRGLPVDDIARILYETMPDNTSPDAEAYLRATINFILKRDGTVNLKLLSTLLSGNQIRNFSNALYAMETSGIITADERADIEADYLSATTQQNTVRSFISKLNQQIENVFGPYSANCCKMKYYINQKGVIAFDLGASTNELAANLVLNHLMYFQESGKEFAVLVDELPFSKYSRLTDLIRGRLYAVSASDCIARLSGNNDSLFNEIMSSVACAVIFSHHAGSSSAKWSEQLGTYHKLKIKTNYSQTASYLQNSNTEGIQIEEADEPRVSANTISMLPEGLACIHRQDGTLIAPV